MQADLEQLVLHAVADEMTRPLNLINIALDYLRLRLDPEDGEVWQSLDDIGYASARMEQLWRNGSELLSCQRGEITARSEPVDLREMLQEICADAQYIQSKIDVKTILELPEKELYLLTDSAQAERVLANLYGAALQACGKGGAVTLQLKDGKTAAEITIQSSEGGIPADIAKAAFAESETAFSAPGVSAHTGLTLSMQLCSALCRLMEWKASVRRAGKGYAVKLTVPKRQDAAAGKVVFRSQAREQQLKLLRQERVRRVLGGVPGLDAFWIG